MNEHGWNDPPVFTYSSLHTGSGGKRTQLNKRVNHDLSATPNPPPSTQAPHTIANPPPSTQSPPKAPDTNSSEPPKAVIPSLEHTTQDITSATAEDTSDSVTVTLDSVLECVDRVIEKHKDTIPDRNKTEIRSRLSVFSDQWKNGKLSDKVQTAMAKLAAALECGDFSLADKIHVALMVNHVSEVSRWMVGVKRLIAIVKQQSSD